MDTELGIAQTQIMDLKAELDFERKSRKMAESTNKKLVKELVEERRGRKALEKVCEELEKKISSEKTEIDQMKREIEAERKMLRMAEVIREERVQMKMADAKILFEEKMVELEENKQTSPDCSVSKTEQRNQEDKEAVTVSKSNASSDLSGKVLGENSCCNNRIILGEKVSMSPCNENISRSASTGSILSGIHRKASPEPENPHIRRGIKGFVEFPRVVRAIGSKSSRNWGNKLECQKAQLGILLKQKSPIRPNNLIIS